MEGPHRWLRYQAGLLVQAAIALPRGHVLWTHSSCLELGRIRRVADRPLQSPYPDDWFALEADLVCPADRGLHLITGTFLRDPDGLLCWRRDQLYGSFDKGDWAVDFLVEADRAHSSGTKEVQVVIRSSINFGAQTLLGKDK